MARCVMRATFIICYVIYFKIKAFNIAYSKKQDDESSVGGALCDVEIRGVARIFP